MVKRAEGRAGGFLAVLLAALVVCPVSLGAFEKKIRVVWDYAQVFLQPDEGSPVIETIEQGAVLSLLYGGKMKKSWYYVCFKSEKTGATKSGYIFDSAVELMFDSLRTITIMEEKEHLTVDYAPRKFGEMQWGVSKKHILEMEGKPHSQERVKGLDIMRYVQKVSSMDCAIEYIFTANKLSKTKFSFLNTYPEDKNAHLEDYRKIKNALVQKFGRPVEENMNWSDSSYRDDFSNWGEAITLGHLALSSLWQTPQTEITASLGGSGEEINLVVEFAALQARELAKKSQEE
jgi:hypothetical protein